MAVVEAATAPSSANVRSSSRLLRSYDARWLVGLLLLPFAEPGDSAIEAGPAQPIVPASLANRHSWRQDPWLDHHSHFHVVQQDASLAVMDWPIVHDQDSRYEGAVFVMDEDGSQIDLLPVEAPTDGAAEAALERLGWHRQGPWQQDDFGRRTAVVEPDPRTRIEH